MSSSSIDAPKSVLDLLNRLHQKSLGEEALLKDPNGQYKVMLQGLEPSEMNRVRDEAMKDKFIALDADKAAFMYNLVRATGALNVVEAGTSYGVSTVYLALAVGQNAKAAGKGPGEAKVIGTEHWHEKAQKARQYWKEAGEAVEPWIELREGDITVTLQQNMPTIDMVLFDSESAPDYRAKQPNVDLVWTPLVVPTLKVIESKLKPGAVLLADNVRSSTTGVADGYREFVSIITAPGSKYKSVTLPFEGGFEMVTYWP